MKPDRFRLTFLLGLVLTVGVPLSAQRISFAGVLGNSGEQGASLVHFAPAPARGLGLVYDSYGSIWDRAGSGRLNRYALDGRLLGSYPITSGDGHFDRQTFANGNVILFLNGSLYRLPIDAPPGTHPTALGISADQMSFASGKGEVAILQRNSVKLLNTQNWTLNPIIQNLNIGLIYDLAILDDESVVLQNATQFRLFTNGSEVTRGWPKNLRTSRVQHLGAFWYGFDFHGTIRRFDGEFQPAPGVVLGGASGYFVSRVDTNEEVYLGNGMALLGEASAAVSGRNGIVSLLEWSEDKQQYRIARRLGAVTNCHGLAINDNGSVWFNAGRWNWDDLPTSPLSDYLAADGTLGQVVSLNDGSFLAAVQRDDMVTIVHSMFDSRNQLANGISLPPAMVNAATTYSQNDGTRVLILADARGNAISFTVDSKNMPQKSPAPVVLHFASPVNQLTTLAMENESVMLAAVDGAICELKLQGNAWQESGRWNSWGTGGSEHFGSQIYIATEGNQLWVSDTTRNRVLLFDLPKRTMSGSFGQIDQAGDDFGHLNHPAVIATRHGLTVVFDSDNQRLVKLQFSGS